MIVVGIDLSRPTDHRDTVMIWGRTSPTTALSYVDKLISPSDKKILQTISSFLDAEPSALGFDAPSSYNDGGGFRDADRSLQKAIIRLGMRPGSIMVPTLTRVCHLTLRGLGLSRSIMHLPNAACCRIVETHPGAVFGLHAAPIEDVLSYRDYPESRQRLDSWLENRKMKGLPENLKETSRATAACRATLASSHSALNTS